MAKLNNVKVTASQIEVSGIKFTQTDDSAVIGDIIRFDDSSRYVTNGAYYEITRMDWCDDPQITDDVGDEFDLCAEEYTVFKKSSVTSILSVGDFAKVVERLEGHSASIGDIVKIVEDDSSDLPFRCTYADGSTIQDDWFYPDELERVEVPAATIETSSPTQTSQAAPTALPDAYIVHDGKVYAKEARKAVVGDLVVVTSNTQHYIKVGEIVEAVNAGNIRGNKTQFTDPECFRDGSTQYVDSTQYNVLVPTDSVTIDGVDYTLERRDAERGENVVITHGDGHYISIGQIVEAVERSVVIAKQAQFRDTRQSCLEQYGMTGQYIVLTPKAAETPAPLKVGDYVKITISQSGAPVGSVVKVTHKTVYGSIDYVWKGTQLGASDGYYVPATPEEIAAVTPPTAIPSPTFKEREIAAKWTAIGRTTGQIKCGDIVKVAANGQITGHKPGVIGIAEYNGSVYTTSVAANGASWLNGVELVAPVESLFTK